ncbi:MAG TPA: RNA degradosome polyphosphate kinase, partial [Actinocrinis sp.]|nr:RNA degradosome polyphosphate kinase [Actinocrinis sp.]
MEPAADLPRFLDRESSWLQFNSRVLELAEDKEVPLLERAKFAAIFANNLDEFFMVRVAGLKRRIATGATGSTASGFTHREVLQRIWATTRELMIRHAQLFQEQVRPELTQHGIEILRWGDFDA